jgi:hypothetical protein
MYKSIFSKPFILLLTLFSANTHAMAQKSTFNRFMQLHYPEKIWVICHPFAAKKALQIGLHARDVGLQKINDPDLDKDYNGGQVDAFRHGYWMALLTQEIGAFSARWLGKAHEKSNYLDFKNKVLEEGSLPDYTACEMDLKNNEQGIKIGKQKPDMKREEIEALVKKKILEGEFFIIKKNTDGEFLNSSGERIPKERYLGLWHNPKTLVPSNYKRPEPK